MISDNIKNQINDTLDHKILVIKCGQKMCNYLFETDQNDLAISLIKRIIVHDNSKFNEKELCGMSILKDNTALIDPNVLLSEDQKEIIEEHWKHNRHHPEYFNDVTEMQELDIIEMVCDWGARSIQYKTDLIEFVKIRQNNRFHFPEKMYKKILNYCYILLKNNDKDNLI